MNDMYYVQSQARRILKCIHPDTYAAHKVCPEYLDRLNEEEFWEALRKLRELFISYYSQAAQSPASLNLPLFGTDEYRSTSGEAREGNAALLRLPAALLAMAKCA